MAVRGGRGGHSSIIRNFFTYRIFVSALFTLLFVATLSVIFSTNPSTPQLESVSLPFTHFIL